MKKICIYVAIAIALVAGYACTQEEKEVKITKTEQAAFDDLCVQIAALNASYGVDDASRADKTNKKKKRRFWKIFGADLAGTLDGVDITWGKYTWIKMLICGVKASVDEGNAINKAAAADPELTAYRPVKSVMDNPNTFEIEALPNEPTLLDSLGYYHNEIICYLYAQHGDDLMTYDEAALDEKIRRQVAIYTGDMNALTVEGLRPDYKEVLSAISEDNLEQTFTALRTIRPHIANELTVVQEYCSALTQFETDEEIVAYTKAYNGLVAISNIMEGSKQFIKGATLIGGHSAIMWMPVEESTEGDGTVTEP